MKDRHPADDRIRLLKIVPTLRYGGTERQFMALSASLDPSRFRVELACLRPGGGLAAEAVHHGLPVDTYDIGPFHSPDRKSTRLNSSHLVISYAVFCLK